MKPLDHQVAIVTGASRGIGRAIASALALAGARVVLVSRNERALGLIVDELSSKGVEAVCVRADVTNHDEIHRMVDSVVQRFGRIDIVVNNAGIGYFREFVDLPVDEFDAMWNVNVRGVFLVTRAVLPHMLKAKRGNIVTIGSLAGKNTFKGGAGYSATKWALRGLMGSLMLEVRDSNIRSIMIFPGSVDTDFSGRSKKGENIPKAGDVAEAVLYAVTAPQRLMVSEIDLRPTVP